MSRIKSRITPFLWFDGQAEEAASFYTSIFEDSRVREVVRRPEGVPGTAGEVLTVAFTLDGLDFTALNGGPEFKFTEAVSFVVNCETQDEVDHYWGKLSEGGTPIQCGWLKDRYGLAWQIVPAVLPELLRDKDPEKTRRVAGALMKMIKLDVEELLRAYRGA